MRSIGVAWGVTSTRIGSIRSSSERRAISFGMVAENSSDWRSFGIVAMIFLTSPDKAHVEHAVGLVEDKILDRAELELALVHEVEQAARRGDDDIDAAGQRVDLGFLG